MTAHGDTIAAIATPSGRGAVGILRLSGPRAAAVAGILCGPLPPARHAALRAFRDFDGADLDCGLVIHFPAPHSYTGEDVVELQGHGGRVVMDLLLRAACAAGARVARPGEFSERAFLNGRIDLAQAEAVADLIDAATAAAAKAARRSLDGVLSRRVTTLADALIELRVYIEGTLDFSEEDVDWLTADALSGKLAAIRDGLDELLHEAAHGRRLSEGYTVALAGQPNVGKSTLLNRLAGADVAIVTEIPGTTRDLLREHIDLRGLPLTLVDTAGLRESEDPIEREGVARARRAFEQVELLLFLVDARVGVTAADRALLAGLPAALPRLIVHNKIDLCGQPPRRREDTGEIHLHLSAASGAGIESLVDEILRRAGGSGEEHSGFSARSRHITALNATRSHLDAAEAQLHAGGLPELAAEELRLAQEALGEITGRFGNEELLGRIFASFCIGK